MILDMYRMAEAYVASGAGLSADSALSDAQRRLALLCESHAPLSPVYVLHSDGAGGARLARRELEAGEAWRLPFIKVAPNAAYLTPVFKVERKKGIADSKRTTTVRFFRSLVAKGSNAASYFSAVCDLLQATQFRGPGTPKVTQIDNAFATAVASIVKTEAGGGGSPESKRLTPLLCVALDTDGRVWPGDDDRLVQWLLSARERLTIYQTQSVVDPEDLECPLTGKRGRLYSNALAGAGLNFANSDFRGSFSEQRDERAWSRGGLSSEAADLLYIYKNHVAPNFLDTIAGSRALVLPSADVSDPVRRQQFYDLVGKTVEAERRESREQTILRRFSGQTSVATLTLLWASFGQKFEDARGFITGILPSRLADLERINTEYKKRSDRFFPRDNRYRRDFDLRFALAAELLYRPGGASVKHENASPRRHAILRDTARCIYHGRRMPDMPLWREIDATARAYLVVLLNDSDYATYQIAQEGPTKPKKYNALTLNGWVRHMAMFLSYLSDERIGVLEREENVFEPKNENLRPLFADATGLDNDAKRFAFLLGVLYGHLIYVQGRKAGVNVAANALSWLRGGRIRAAELPSLYAKLASKLTEYHALDISPKYRRIFEIESELAHIGVRVGDSIDPQQLSDEKSLYYLMLGMALSYDFTRSERGPDSGSESSQPLEEMTSE